MEILTWIFIGLSLLATAATYLFMPQSQKGPEPDPATLDDFTRATADQDRVIPKVFGMCEIKPNLLYYGNLNTVKRKKHGQTIGYAYYLDMVWGIANGIDELRQFRLNEKVMIDLENLVDVTLSNASFNSNTMRLTETGAFAGFEAWEIEGKRISVYDSETEPTIGGVFTISQKIDDDTIELTSMISVEEEPITGLKGSKWKILVKTGHPSTNKDARPTKLYRSVIEWTDGTQTALPAYWQTQGEIDPDVAYKGVALIYMRQAFIGDDVRSVPNYSAVVKRCQRILNTSVIDVVLSDASWTCSTKKLAEAGAFENYTWSSGDKILITGDSSENVGIQALEIAGKDSDDQIELVTDDLDSSSDRTGVTGAGNPSDIEDDANAAEILYYIYTQMTDVPTSYMALSYWENAALKLKAEGMGISVPMNKSKTAESWEKDILRHVDGYVYLDDSEGKFTIKLQRELTTAEKADLPVFTNADFKDLKIKRGAWESVYSDLICKGTSRRTFKLFSYALVNPASRVIMNYRKSQTVSFPFAFRSEVLSELIRRCLRRYFYPYAVSTFRVSQVLLDSMTTPVSGSAVKLYPGDAFKFTDSTLGFNETIFRVASCGGGDDSRKQEIEIEATEDNIIYEDLAEIPIPATELLPSEKIVEPVSYAFLAEIPPCIAAEEGSLMPVAVSPVASQDTDLFRVSKEWMLLADEREEIMGDFNYARGTGTLKSDLAASYAMVDEILIENPVDFVEIDNSTTDEKVLAWQKGEVLLLVCDYRQTKACETSSPIIEDLVWTASTKRLTGSGGLFSSPFSGYTWSNGDRILVLQDDSGNISEQWVDVTAKIDNNTIEIATLIDASDRTGVQIRPGHKHGGMYYELLAPQKLEEYGAYWKASRVLRGVAGEPRAWCGEGTPSRTARVFCLTENTSQFVDQFADTISSIGEVFGEIGGLDYKFEVYGADEDDEEYGPPTIMPFAFMDLSNTPLPPENLRCWRFDSQSAAEAFAAGDDTQEQASNHGQYLLIAYAPRRRAEGATIVDCSTILAEYTDKDPKEYLNIDKITSGVYLSLRERGWFYESDGDTLIKTGCFEIHKIWQEDIHTLDFFVSTKIGNRNSKTYRKPELMSSTY